MVLINVLYYSFKYPTPMCLSLSFYLVQALVLSLWGPLRALIDLNCPDWPHLRPPTYTLCPWTQDPHWRLGLGLQVLTWPPGGPWSCLTPCCAHGPCYLPPTFSLVGLHPLVRAGLHGVALSSHLIPSPLLVLRAHFQGKCAGCWWSVSAIWCFWKRYWAARSTSFWLVLFAIRTQGGWPWLSSCNTMVRSASSRLLFSALSFLFVLRLPFPH